MEALVPLLDRAVGDSINAVDARELHRSLEVGRDFSNWIKSRIAELGLVEGADFEVFANPGENPSGGRPRIEYAVALDAAKHIALAERTEVGRRVRAYFIAAEKRLREAAVPTFDPADPRVVLAVLEAQVEKVRLLESTVETQRAELAVAAPKVDVFDRVIASGETIGFREAAKILRRSTGVTERELSSTLIRRGWAQRLGKRLAPAHYGEEHGYVTSRLSEWTDIDGVTHSKPEFRITPKGLARLAEILAPEVAA